MSTPRPGPTSSETSVGLQAGEPLDDAEQVAVDQEVLAERVLRRDGSHGRLEPERGCRVGVDPRFELVRRLVSRVRQGRERVTDVRGLVGATADRLRGEVRAVGLREQAIGGNLAAAVRRASAFGYVTFPANET